MSTPLPENFDSNDARKFIDELFQQLFTLGHADAVEDFYHPDIVRHFRNGLINLDDIKQRVVVLKNEVSKPKYDVIWCQVIDKLIIYTCQQSWIAKADNRLYDALVFVVYRVEEGKISEVWLELDTPTPDYQTINRAFLASSKTYEVNEKDKTQFLRKLEHYLQSQEKKTLTTRQAESLYYYFNGFSSKEASKEMGLSPRTFEGHINQVKDIFGCNTKHELRQHLKIA